jgi:hypothetical protein
VTLYSPFSDIPGSTAPEGTYIEVNPDGTTRLFQNLMEENAILTGIYTITDNTLSLTMTKSSKVLNESDTDFIVGDWEDIPAAQQKLTVSLTKGDMLSVIDSISQTIPSPSDFKNIKLYWGDPIATSTSSFMGPSSKPLPLFGKKSGLKTLLDSIQAYIASQ